MSQDGRYKRDQNKHHIGPGGINCICCGPAPGKERKNFIRSRKRSEKNSWKQKMKQYFMRKPK